MRANNGAPMTPTLIVTRPVLQGDGFAADIATRWHGPLTIIQSPLIEIVPIASQVDQLDGAIFTSTNGVGAAEIMELPKGLTAWCVGAKTAEAARKVGFCPITGPGDAEGLVNAIIANAPKGKLVHIRGRHARGDVCTTLVAAGLHCIDVVAYDQQPLQLNEDAKVALSAEYPRKDRPGA